MSLVFFAKDFLRIKGLKIINLVLLSLLGCIDFNVSQFFEAAMRRNPTVTASGRKICDKYSQSSKMLLRSR
jgi:hypothetical protein